MSRKFRQAERLLYTYPLNLMRLRDTRYALWRLRVETDCHAQNYDKSPSSAGSHSDPPGQYVQQLMTLESQSEKFMKSTAPIRELRYRLGRSSERADAQKLSVMELHYFEHMTLRDLALHLQTSERTIFRRRDELINELIAELKL